MAQQEVNIGNAVSYLYEDTDTYPDDASPVVGVRAVRIRCTNAPSSGDDVLRQDDVGGGGAVAPANAAYVTIGNSGDLSDERALTAGDGIGLVDGGANSTVTLAVDGTVLRADGSVPLTADWDVGSFKITAEQLESDIASGTAPLIVASNTVVANLNADLLDGVEESAFLLADGTRGLSGDWDAGAFEIKADDLVANNSLLVGTTTPISGVDVVLYGTGITEPVLAIKQVNDAALSGTIAFIKESTTPADGDLIGAITYTGKDSGGNDTAFGQLLFKADDVTDTDEAGLMEIDVLIEGTTYTVFAFHGMKASTPGEAMVQFNPEGQDVDVVFTDASSTNAVTFDAQSGEMAFTNAPLFIASPGFAMISSTVITDLNADQLDGNHETAFALLAGRSGGQTLIGGTAASNVLTLKSTSNATKGTINVDESQAVTFIPFGTSAGETTELRFLELAANGSDYIGFKSSDALAASVIWTLPVADGSADQVLKTDGSGILSWTTPAGGSSPLTTKGDIYTYDTGDSRLAIGTDGQVLKADSAQATGLVWADFDHGGLDGLTDDDHSQYLLLAGRSGGQIIHGGTGAGDDIRLQTTTHATKGVLVVEECLAIVLYPAGTGAGETQPIRFLELAANGGHSVDVKAPDALAASYDLTLPIDAGSSGEFLQTNGSGVLSWAAASGSSPLTTKGDLYTYDTGDQRLAVGTNDFVLTADSAQATGIKWAAIPDLAIGDAITSGTSGSILYVDASGQLAQDNADLFFDVTNTRLGINTSSPDETLHMESGTAKFVGPGAANTATVIMENEGATNAHTILEFTTATPQAATRPQFFGRKSRGSIASPTQISASDSIFSVLAFPYINGAFRAAASIEMKAGTSIGASSYATTIGLWTTPNGATSRSVKFEVDTNGDCRVVQDLEIDGDLNHDGSNIGFFGTAPAAKQTVSGSRGGNAALADLLTELAEYGLITDSTTA